MNLLKIMLTSGLGAAALLTAGTSLVSFLVVGSIALVPIAVNSLLSGFGFGGAFALAHMARPITFGSSVFTGIGFAIVLLALSVWTGGATGAPSPIGYFIYGVILGVGGFIGTGLGSSVVNNEDEPRDK